MKPRTFDISEIRQKLENQRGPQYWRSLEELADTPQFQEYLHREFPQNASEWLDGISRRGFLKIMGASLALAGLSACTKQPPEAIVPYVRQPEEIIPGRPLFYASALTLGGYAQGVLVESHMGRPTKVEGNPEHPASLGASSIFSQASILGLYDPDRSQSISNIGEISSWSDFLAVLQSRMAVEKGRPVPGSGLRILSETITSPTLAGQINGLITAFPGIKWIQYDPVSRDEARQGTIDAFGEPVECYYRMDRADVVVSLENDFLGFGPAQLRYARDLISRRRGEQQAGSMNRLYVIESTPTNTGAFSDHRFPVRSSDIQEIARLLMSAISGESAPNNARYPWLAAIANDLLKHRGRSIITAGDHQPAIVHALVHAMNSYLGNNGQTVVYIDPVEANPQQQLQALKELCVDMNAGKVDTLVILGGNPVYTAPVDFNFAANLSKVPLRIRLGLYEDETSDLCHWHVPEVHSLEGWSDARAFDGTTSIVQPLIAPLYEGCRSSHEILAAMAGHPGTSAHDLVQAQWRKGYAGANFEKDWRKWLHDGLIPNTTSAEKTVTARATTAMAAAPSAGDSLEINFRPDPSIYDGRFANIGWLQELPKPLTTLTWDNVVLVGPQLAQKLDVTNEDVVELQLEGRKVTGPVWVLPGHAANSMTVYLGFGRNRSGRVGTGVGFNVYELRSSTRLAGGTGVSIRKTGDRYRLAATQEHHMMEGRNLVRQAAYEEFEKDPGMFHDHEEKISLFPDFKYEGYSWGMAVDLTACIGCNACVVACVSENNIPVVGKEQVIAQREMHWIRIDRYYEGDMDNPTYHNQPLMCQQCENAPCEVVCPVGATVHSAEGLNDMVYNRCVGTRYCSNNCPYKVRRFNFFLYSDLKTPTLKMMRNPDVTVRTRGVMEKCTYCVQRINAARITAEKEDRKIRDGEIVTACAQACPADAIVFGNINDPESRIAKWRANHRNYGILTELNTRPRTTYLAKLKNPNTDVKG